MNILFVRGVREGRRGEHTPWRTPLWIRGTSVSNGVKNTAGIDLVLQAYKHNVTVKATGGDIYSGAVGRAS